MTLINNKDLIFTDNTSLICRLNNSSYIIYTVITSGINFNGFTYTAINLICKNSCKSSFTTTRVTRKKIAIFKLACF